MNEVSWIDDAVFYHIYPLGFTGSPKWNEGDKTSGSRILEILDWIPHLKSMGVNAIYFGPVLESLSHGYNTSDYYKTDRRLGTAENFKNVFSELHKNGIRIVLDGVFNHVGRGFWAFNDLQHKLSASEYKDWFTNIDFSRKSPAGDDFSYEMWEGNSDLIKLNLKNPDVCEHLLGAVRMWITEFDIDGLRLDAADCVDKDFFRLLHKETKALKSDFWLMGEIIHGDYTDWANEEMLDSVTNYECWKGIYSSHNDKNYYEIAYSLNRQFGGEGIYKHLNLYNFLDNHDVNRIGSLLHDKRNLKNAYTILFTMPGIPSVYYGSEFGIEAEKTHGEDADRAIRPKLNLESLLEGNCELLNHIIKLSRIRQNSCAIKTGKYKQLFISNEMFAYVRYNDEMSSVIMLNMSDEYQRIRFTYNTIQYKEVLNPHSSSVIHIASL